MLAWLDITRLIRDAGYAGLFAAVLLENLVPPIPSEVVLPFAGWQVARGELLAIPAFLAATAGSVVGALILYAVALRRGRDAILATHRFSRVTPRDLDRADERFRRHGVWLVLFGRCGPGLRSVVSVPAGMARMPLAQFTVLTTLGSATWNAALMSAGAALGDEFEDVGADRRADLHDDRRRAGCRGRRRGRARSSPPPQRCSAAASLAAPRQPAGLIYARIRPGTSGPMVQRTRTATPRAPRDGVNVRRAGRPVGFVALKRPPRDWPEGRRPHSVHGMPFLRFIDREPAAALFAVAGLTAIVVLASLGEPVVGGLLAAAVAGYVTARSLTDAGRDEIYRATDRVLGLMWLLCLLLLAGLAIDWVGLVDPAGDVSRLEAFGWGVPAACVVGFVHGAWHEHLERAGQNQIA